MAGLVRPDDLMLVNRAGADFQTEVKNLRKPISDHEPLPNPVPLPWEGHNGGIWHIKNATETLPLYDGPYVAWDIDGTNQREIEEVAVGEELLFVTGPVVQHLFYGHLGNWDFGDLTDTSNVTDMSFMFNGSGADGKFNGTFGGNWDFSNVKNMSSMFWYCYEFNQDISNWDVSNVTNMASMFFYAYVFNQDISNWDVSNVTDMQKMFTHAKAFNQDISGWDVSNVENMRGMFDTAEAFNKDIGSWDVGNVADMLVMFMNAKVFNQNLTGWCVTNIKSEPSNFKLGSRMPSNGSYDPKWGTCPRGENNP